MRSTFLTVLASSALLVTAAEINRDTVLEDKPEIISIAIGRPECVYNEIRNSNISCDVAAILECFEAETTLSILDRIQQCLSSSGCVSKEYIEESYIWADKCRPTAEIEADRIEDKELRRRKDDKSSTTSDASTTEESTTASAATAVSSVTSDTSTATSTSAASAAASTTVVSSTTSSDSTTLAGSTLSTSTTSTSSETTTSTSSNSCFDFSTSTTTACYVTDGAQSCVPTTAIASSCASGMYCTTDSAGSDVCMVEDNTLTPSGLAVAIVFGTAVFTFIVTMISCACKDSRRASARQKMMEARLEADAKEALLAVEEGSAGKGRGMGLSQMGRSGTGASNNGFPRGRSPLGSTLAPSVASEDTRTLLGGSAPGSRLPSPGPQPRTLTGGSASSRPSRSEEGAYSDARS